MYFSQFSGGWEVQVKMSANSVPAEGSLPGMWTVAYLPRPDMGEGGCVERDMDGLLLF